jgi:hypothetical protein
VVLSVSVSIGLHYFYTHWELYITGYQDDLHARKRFKDKLRAEEHAKLMARLQRVLVILAWNYVTSRIPRAVQSRLSQITYLLTCWRLWRVDDYGYMEPINIMKETRERAYWEIFRKGRQAAQA